MYGSPAEPANQPRKGLFVEHATLFSLLARLADILAIAFAALAAHWFRFGNLFLGNDYQVAIIGASLLALFLFPHFGLYQSLRGLHWSSWAQRLISAWVSLLLCLIFIAWATKTTGGFSRLWMGYWAGTGLVFLLVSHAMMMYVLSKLRERGLNQKRVLIAGTGNAGQQVIKRLDDYPWAGLRVIAAVDDDPRQQRNEIENVKVLGYLKDLPLLVSRLQPDEVWITLPLSESHQINRVLGYLQDTLVNVRYVPDVQGLRLLNHSITDVAGMAVLNLTMSPIEGTNTLTKMIEDYIFGALILLVASPFMLFIAMAIKLDSPGPVLFRQRRHGCDGRQFEMLKFRTMTEHQDEPIPTQAKKHDARVTRIGAILRRTSLDELPQLLNVLKGDMSLVGPRPHAVEHNDHYRQRIEAYMLRHKMKPGITGWAQVNGWRGETDNDEKMKRRIEHDLYYIENWSLGLDMKILAMTAYKGFINENAY